METKPLIITRTVDAPRDAVWKAWTEKDALAQWWGPKGMKITHITLDFRPEGMFHYNMVTPDGSVMWGKFIYKEIEPTHRLTFINSFSNEYGETVRAAFSEHWPLEVMNTLILEEENGKTKLTLTGGPVNPTEEERKLFESMTESMNQGFAGTFEQLDEYLASK